MTILPTPAKWSADLLAGLGLGGGFRFQAGLDQLSDRVRTRRGPGVEPIVLDLPQHRGGHRRDDPLGKRLALLTGHVRKMDPCAEIVKDAACHFGVNGI